MFQVTVISNINSVANRQREINNIFRNIWDCARLYVNNIIWNAKSLDNMLEKLQILLQKFVAFNISIKSIKTFFNYSDVGLLGQKVNCLSFTIIEKNLRVIKELIYLNTFRALKYHLGLAKYLSSYIHFYTQLTEPLQELKISLLRQTSFMEQQTHVFVSKTKLDPSSLRQWAFFKSLQEPSSRQTIFVYYNLSHILELT